MTYCSSENRKSEQKQNKALHYTYWIFNSQIAVRAQNIKTDLYCTVLSVLHTVGGMI